MTTIIIKPNSNEDIQLLTSLFKKMNIEAEVYNDKQPNNETLEAIYDVNNKKGTRVKGSNELFENLDI